MSSRHLRVVAPDSRPEKKEQLTFAFGQENALWVASFPDMDADEFLAGLREAKPRVVIDLRPVPDFLKPGLNRGRLFRELDSLRAAYRDLGGVNRVQQLANPHIVAEQLDHILESCRAPFGPIVLLIDQTSAIARAAMMLHEVLAPTAKGSWTLRIMGKPTLKPAEAVKPR